MASIKDDNDFRQAVMKLDPLQQRLLAARFVEHVMPLCADDRIARVVNTAADPGASADALASALKSAKAAAIDMHTRCGSLGDWLEQAGYFVCRAAVAALAPSAQTIGGNPAWHAAMSSRMAHTSVLISEESAAIEPQSENEWQYRALEDYITHKGETQA